MYKTSDVIKKLDKPVLTYKDTPYNSALIFNASVEKINGKYVMLFRNDYGDFENRKLEVKENCNVNEIARFLAKRIRAYDGCLGIMRR